MHIGRLHSHQHLPRRLIVLNVRQIPQITQSPRSRILAHEPKGAERVVLPGSGLFNIRSGRCAVSRYNANECYARPEIFQWIVR